MCLLASHISSCKTDSSAVVLVCYVAVKTIYYWFHVYMF